MRELDLLTKIVERWHRANDGAGESTDGNAPQTDCLEYLSAYREEIEAPLRAEINRLKADRAELQTYIEEIIKLEASLGTAFSWADLREFKEATRKIARAALDLPAPEAKKPSKHEELLEAHLSAYIDQMDQVAKMFRDDEDFMRALNEAREILYPSKETSNGPRA